MKRKNSDFFSVLWEKIQGEYRDSIQSGEFKGVAKFMLLSPAKALLVGLVGGLFGPAATFAMPLVEFVIAKTFNAVWETASETFQGFGTFDVHTTKSGLAILENPRLITPENAVLELPDEIEIPSETLVRPEEDWIYKPTFQRSFRRQPNVLVPRRTLAGLRSQSRPSFLEEGSERSFNSRRLNLLFKTLPQTGSSLTDVVYPRWVLTGDPSDNSLRGRNTSTSMSFSDWYQKDRRSFQNSLKSYASIDRKFQRDSAARALKTHQDFMKRSQESAQRARKIHDDFVKSSHESAQRARKAHDDFVKRTQRNNNFTKPPWKK